MSDVEKMLAEWLEYLDDEDGESPFPEWAGETGWVTHDNGSMEDWGQYLLRLAHDENASLTEKVERLREWCNRVADYVLNWLEGKDDIDFTVHADRLLRDLCNCENELPPCEVCERLALLEGSE